VGFTSPNEAAATHPEQAEVHEADWLILAAGLNGYGVVSGCAVTAQGSPDMTVAVAAGTALVGSSLVTVAGGNVTITADGSNPRYVLIEVDSAGAKTANAGTAAANPAKPTPTSTKTVLAEVYVPAADTAIASGQIIDKRVLLGSIPRQALVQTDETTTSDTFTDLATAGPAVTVTTGTSVLLLATAEIYGTTTGGTMAIAVSGATTRAAVEDYTAATSLINSSANTIIIAALLTGLTAGSNTFTCKYKRRGGAGTPHFLERQLIVIP
jgi:hypothetical protein